MKFDKLFPYACDFLTGVKDYFILKEKYNPFCLYASSIL